MKKNLILQSLFFFLFTCFSFVMFTSCTKSTRVTNDLSLPDGFSATVVAETVGSGRHIIVNTNGDMYVSLKSLKNKGGIAALRDTNGDGKADIIKYFGKYTGTGIGIHNGYLYFGSDSMIVRYKLRENQLLPDTNAEIIAKGFIYNPQHEAKSFDFDDEGNMYVNVGAPANACQQPDRTPGTKGINPCPLLEHFAGIWRFKADLPNQDKDIVGYRYSTGTRNCVALRWNHKANHLYAIQHGRDQLHEFWPDIYSQDDGVELPAEEFFLIKDGGDYGWPYCYFDPAKNKKLLAPEYGGNAKNEGLCATKEKPILAFPAHTAPNDLVFYTGSQFPEKYKNGAFIAFHGSWNRAPKFQKGYYVAFVPFESDKPKGGWEIFANGFAGSDSIKSTEDAKHRPCGLAQGPDGSLFVVDSREGKIWKITFKS